MDTYDALRRRSAARRNKHHASITHGASQSESTVVTAEALSATNLSTAGCATGTDDVTEFGTVVAGTNNVTGADCTVTFGSSNNTAMLRAYQADSGGVGMWMLGDGSPDLGFSGDGISEIPLANNQTLRATLVQPDGKILVVGWHQYGTDTDIFLARFLTDGSLDTANFGAPNGYVITDLGCDERGEGFALQPDGKILVSGVSNPGELVLVARYNEDGTLDTADFGNPNGYVTVNPGGGLAFSVAPQSDGKIVAVGNGGGDIWIGRFNEDGSLDTTGFAAPVGWTIFNIDPGIERGTSVSIQPDGKILMAGHYPLGGGNWQFATARYNADGTLDTDEFGAPNGYVQAGPGAAHGFVKSMVLQPDGNIVLAGEASNGADDDFGFIRLLSDGSVDPDFGTAGRVMVDFPANGLDRAKWVEALPDGRLVAAGYTVAGGFEDVGLVRLMADGTPDPSFGVDGLLSIPVGAADDRSYGIALGQDGEIAASIYYDAGGHDDAAVVVLESTKVSDYANTVTDWDTADTNLLGACLRTISGAGVTGTWTVDADNTCAAADADPWNRIVATASTPGSKIAASTTAGTTNAMVSMRFGFRTLASQKPGTYLAPIVSEVVAPNA